MKFNLETIIIFVRNVEKLKDFYVGILELEIIEEIPSQWILLQAGDCKIGLHQIGESYLSESAQDFQVETNTKMVFEINEDLANVRDTLISKNVKMREIMVWENYPYILCDGEDTEGNVFQLKQKIATM
ncbi:MAG TPA: hypothetical protein PLY70_10715 [Saprospiraceae bacterium]|nr:hypothetical protein [Saprospiraceae bacterium]HPN70528.1 hypothetical protein [Saprospiraceae bacterium]